MDAGGAVTVEAITAGIDALDLENGAGSTPHSRIRKSTKAMFRRASNKYQGNNVRRLDAVEGCPLRADHAKADTLADTWVPILKQRVRDPGPQDAVAAWMKKVEDPTMHQQAVTSQITEAEVAVGLNDCKSGKATGPIHLGTTGIADTERN
ncbi:hypothetical protein PInf_018167 [Phytophthora infestans]|nr:hypothetical protein PInf_018167 [Phytophthora infestans]